MARERRGGLVVGLLLVGLGLLLLLDATDTIEFGEFLSDFWPLALVAWGLLAIRRERGRSVPGSIVLLLGIGFLLENLGVFADDWLSKAWPVAIIVVGLALVLGALRSRRPPPAPSSEGPASVSSSDLLDAVAVMSGRREAVTSTAWRGGTATAVMGGIELDLRRARPVPGGAQLRTTAFMGGIEIRVPAGWVIELRGTPFLGGFDDKTSAAPAPEGAPRLIVSGTAIMGGVEVKH